MTEYQDLILASPMRLEGKKYQALIAFALKGTEDHEDDALVASAEKGIDGSEDKFLIIDSSSQYLSGVTKDQGFNVLGQNSDTPNQADPSSAPGTSGDTEDMGVIVSVPSYAPSTSGDTEDMGIFISVPSYAPGFPEERGNRGSTVTVPSSDQDIVRDTEAHVSDPGVPRDSENHGSTVAVPSSDPDIIRDPEFQDLKVSVPSSALGLSGDTKNHGSMVAVLSSDIGIPGDSINAPSLSKLEDLEDQGVIVSVPSPALGIPGETENTAQLSSVWCSELTNLIQAVAGPVIEARQVYLSRLLNLGEQVNLSRLLNLGEQVSSFRIAGRISTRRLIKIPLLYIIKFIQDTVMFLMLWPAPILLLCLFFTLNIYLNLSIIHIRIVGKLSLKKEIPKLRAQAAELFLCIGSFLHNWRVEGLENIPNTGGCLFIYHHGTLPIDYIYLVAFVYLKKGRIIESVVDRSLMLMPGLQTLTKILRCSSPNRQECIQKLKEGRFLGIAPGGGKQAMFDSEWGERRGYAIVAANAQCPVLTVYTGNINYAFLTLDWSRPLFKLIYRFTKIAGGAVYGGLPLTLHTIIDNPLRHQTLFQPEHQPRGLRVQDNNTKSTETIVKYYHPKNRLNLPNPSSDNRLAVHISSSQDWLKVGRRWSPGIKRSTNERDMLNEVRMDLDFLRVELEAFTTACNILRYSRGPVLFEKFEVQHKSSSSIKQSNEGDTNWKSLEEKQKKDDGDEELKEEDDDDYDYNDDPEFNTDMSNLSKEEQSKIIDSLVRKSLQRLKQTHQFCESYGECLEEWLQHQHLDFHHRRLTLFLYKLLPSLVLLFLILLISRILRFLLWDFYAVLMYQTFKFVLLIISGFSTSTLLV